MMTVLDSQDLDAVRELVNIASGNAATALAMLVGQRTMISVPRVTLEPIERIASIIGTPDQPTVVVAMQLLGDVRGFLLYMMPLAPAHALSAMLLGLPAPTSGAFDAAGRSCLEETANVIAGAFVGALGTVVGAVVMISVPLLGIEPPEDVIGDGQAPQGAHLVLLPVGGALEALVSSLQRR